MITRVSKWGNSLGVRIPKAFIADAGLADGAEVELSLEGGRIVIQPHGKQYGLAELAGEITDENRHEEADWGRPVGKESW